MSLLEKLAKIQAVVESASLEGERQAAILAMERLLKRQEQLPMEFRITLPSIWQKKLFVALCHKYKLKTYRYHRQKHTTTMVRISRALMDEILWPEYKKYSSMLQDLVQEVLDSVIAKVGNTEEETVISGEVGPVHELNI
jgi:metal-dependent HD superfamily phosphatase/phosphodiesterase